MEQLTGLSSGNNSEIRGGVIYTLINVVTTKVLYPQPGQCPLPSIQFLCSTCCFRVHQLTKRTKSDLSELVCNTS